jgi:hypothetical protein
MTISSTSTPTSTSTSTSTSTQTSLSESPCSSTSTLVSLRTRRRSLCYKRPPTKKKDQQRSFQSRKRKERNSENKRKKEILDRLGFYATSSPFKPFDWSKIRLSSFATVTPFSSNTPIEPSPASNLFSTLANSPNWAKLPPPPAQNTYTYPENQLPPIYFSFDFNPAEKDIDLQVSDDLPIEVSLVFRFSWFRHIFEIDTHYLFG